MTAGNIIKGVVMELKGSTCIVMTPDGVFEEVNTPGSNVLPGDEIIASPAAKRAAAAQAQARLLTSGRLIKYMGAAAVFLIAIFLGQHFAGSVFAQPKFYVSLDINPSLELAVDGKNRIVSATGLNADGEKILASVHVRRAELSQGISAIVGEAIRQGYLNSGEENIILTTVTTGETSGAGTAPVPETDIESQAEVNSTEQELVLLTAAIEKTLSAGGVPSRVVAEEVKPDLRKNASAKGLSAGKLLFMERARQNNIQLETGDIKESNVRQITRTKNIPLDKLFPGGKKISAGPKDKDDEDDDKDKDKDKDKDEDNDEDEDEGGRRAGQYPITKGHEDNNQSSGKNDLTRERRGGDITPPDREKSGITAPGENLFPGDHGTKYRAPLNRWADPRKSDIWDKREYLHERRENARENDNKGEE